MKQRIKQQRTENNKTFYQCAQNINEKCKWWKILPYQKEECQNAEKDFDDILEKIKKDSIEAEEFQKKLTCL